MDRQKYARPVDCLVGFGSNLGDRQDSFQRAIALLDAAEDVQIIGQSRAVESSAVGGPRGQEKFLNAALRIRATRRPEELLDLLQDVENQLGRVRHQRWGPRTVDLDLLLYGTRIVRLPRLTVPHPRMAYRRFVVAPAAEIAAEMHHPVLGETIGQLATRLDETPHYVAVCDAMSPAQSDLASELIQRFGATPLYDPARPEAVRLRTGQPRGPALEQALESLEERARGFRAAAASGARLIIGDFWFDQSLADWGTGLSGRRWAAFENTWRQLRKGLPRPTLRIFVDRSVVDRKPLSQWLSNGSILRGLASQCGQGPLLRIDTGTMNDELDEAAAAVEAIQQPVAPLAD